LLPAGIVANDNSINIVIAAPVDDAIPYFADDIILHIIIVKSHIAASNNEPESTLKSGIHPHLSLAAIDGVLCLQF